MVGVGKIFWRPVYDGFYEKFKPYFEISVCKKNGLLNLKLKETIVLWLVLTKHKMLFAQAENTQKWKLTF